MEVQEGEEECSGGCEGEGKQAGSDLVVGKERDAENVYWCASLQMR